MDKKLITKALDVLELLDIYLYSSSVDRFEEITTHSYPEDMMQQNMVSVSSEYLDVSEEDGAERVLRARVELGCRFVTDEDGDEMEEVYSELKACFVAVYSQSESVDDKAIDEFLKYNSVHNVWPFWREHAFRVSAEANLPKPVIKLFREALGKEEG